MKIGLRQEKTSFGYNWKGRDGDPDGRVLLDGEVLTAEVPNKYAEPIRATVKGQNPPIEIIDERDAADIKPEGAPPAGDPPAGSQPGGLPGAGSPPTGTGGRRGH